LLNLQSAGRAWLLDTSLMQATELHYDSAGAATDKPCPRIGMGGAVACNIRQLALSASTTSLLGAAVTDDIGCPNGELRVGIVSDLAAPRLFLGATRSDAPNNLAYGVDVSSGRRCPDGVSNPSIASLRSPSGEQALAVWLERSVDAVADSCADPTAVAVLRAIGVWVMPGTQPSVAGTGAGTSQEIGMSAGSARAAVTGFALGGAVRTGYITAFGNADGRLALIVSDALPARTAADTTALSMPEPQPFGAADHIDFVTLAVEPAAPDATELRFGAAYRAGCGDEQTVEIALFRLSISSSFQLENYSTVRITRPSATHIDGNSLRPIITYAADGFRAPDENGVAPGGFIVVFADDAADALRAVRISRDGDLLDTEPYRVEQGRFEAVAPIHEVGRRVSYVAVKRNTRDVVLGRLQCSVD
jgi:hypothetical protein